MTNAQAALIAASGIMGPIASGNFALDNGSLQKLADTYREYLDAVDAAESDKLVQAAQKELSWTNL